MTDISLLLCTRDRCAGLDATLASIARAVAAAPGLAVEAVIVDNGSTDATPARLAAWRVGQSFPVTLLHEPRAGLSRARNRGLAAVRPVFAGEPVTLSVLPGDETFARTGIDA